MTSKRIYGCVILLLFLFVADMCQGQNAPWYKPSAVRAGISLFRQDANQIGGSGMGPGAFLGFQFEPDSRVFLIAGMGLYRATDDFLSWETKYTELKPTVELKAGYKLFYMDRIAPYVNVGVQIGNFVTGEKTKDIGMQYHSKINAGYTAGVGVLYNFYGKNTFFVEGEYRENFGFQGPFKHIYWLVTAGFSFRLRHPVVTKKVEQTDFLSRARFEAEGLFEGIFQDKYIRDPEFRKFFKNLDEVVEKTYPDGRPESMDFEEPVFDSAYEAAIMEEMKEISIHYDTFFTDSAASGEFKVGYEEGLRYFVARDFEASASIFAYLIKHYPDCPLVSNCYYWIGRSFYAQKKYARALLAFKFTVIEEVSPNFHRPFIFQAYAFSKEDTLKKPGSFSGNL